MLRAGFAWLMSPKTSMRGGYGLFYDVLGTNRITVNQVGYSRDTALTPSLDNGQTFRATLSNPFPDGLLDPVGSALGLMTNVGLGVSFPTGYLECSARRAGCAVHGVTRSAPGADQSYARCLAREATATSPGESGPTSPVRPPPEVTHSFWRASWSLWSPLGCHGSGCRRLAFSNSPRTGPQRPQGAPGSCL